MTFVGFNTIITLRSIFSYPPKVGIPQTPYLVVFGVVVEGFGRAAVWFMELLKEDPQIKIVHLCRRTCPLEAKRRPKE